MQTYKSDGKNEDRWKDLFRKLPAEQLPEGFRGHLMERVRKEALRMQRRKERVGLFAVILGALCMLMVGLAGIYVFIEYTNTEAVPIDFGMTGYVVSFLNSTYGSFFVYIGGLALLLLMADAWFRKLYFKHKDM